MGAGNGGVVVDHRDGLSDVVNESLPGGAMGAVRELHADEELGDGDGGDCDFVVVPDRLVERGSRSIGVDQECRVEEEPGQGRLSTSSSSRIPTISRAKPESGRWRRSIALTSLPFPVVTGSSWAIIRPRRTIVNRSPRCSTASRMSEKFLAASVALTSIVESDYQIFAEKDPSIGERSQPRAGGAGVRSNFQLSALRLEAISRSAHNR